MVVPEYGSIKAATVGEEGEADDQERGRLFSEDDTYFLKDSKKISLKKCVSISVPVLIAAILVFGFGYFLFKDFNNLYPGPGSSRSPRTTTTNPSVLQPEPATNAARSPSPSPVSAGRLIPHSTEASKENGSQSSKESNDPSCSAHSKCKALG